MRRGKQDYSEIERKCSKRENQGVFPLQKENYGNKRETVSGI